MITITKSLALCGLCALFAGIGGAASAQGDYGHGPDGGYGHHGPMHHARQAVMHQKAVYARAVAHGNYGVAERAHLRASAIRHHVRAHRAMEQGDGFHHDHGY